jgi:hypothetical protein
VAHALEIARFSPTLSTSAAESRITRATGLDVHDGRCVGILSDDMAAKMAAFDRKKSAGMANYRPE